MTDTSRKILARERLSQVLAERQAKGETVVFTNGCFDLLHAGHIRYLTASRSLGDCLVVAINTDDSVRAIKGDRRPLMCEEDRAEMLAALECVDYVTSFSEPISAPTLDLLRPDIHVKGGDYTLDQVEGASVVTAYGGRVVVMPELQGRSTTDLIARIMAAYGGQQ